MSGELGSRRTSGHGEICWQLDDGLVFVTSIDAGGTMQACLVVTDGRVARELYERPVALGAVPSLFDRAAAIA